MIWLYEIVRGISLKLAPFICKFDYIKKNLNALLICYKIIQCQIK